MPRRKKLVLPYVPNYAKNALTEQFKGEVEIKPVRFPTELGEEHPFSFVDCEKTYMEIGLAKAAVDKHMDFMVSPGFFVESDSKRAEVLINDFIRETDFEHVLRTWIQEALVKGNGFMEIGMSGKPKEILLKVINANNMYVKRNKKGEIKAYNQFVGSLNRMSTSQIIPFLPNEIAHLKFNSIGDQAYGLGICFPAFTTLSNMLKAERDMHIISSRKANSPLQVKLGSLEEPATQADVDDYGAKLEHLNNVHEWVTDHKVDMKVIDFGNLSEKFTTLLEHDRDMLFFIWQIPAVIMGQAKIPEGLANVQMDAFERRIKSLQAAVERVIEEKIFQPILELNGLKAHVEFNWGQLSEIKINERIQQLAELLNTQKAISENLRRAIEIDLAEQLGYKDAVEVLPKPTEGAEEEREREETELKQPELPGEKEMAIFEKFDDLKLNEWLNFDFEEYQKEVLRFIRNDSFAHLLGRNNRDFALGLLTAQQVNQIKTSLENGFKNNTSIREISEEIDKITFKDRFIINQEGKTIKSLGKEHRAIGIARTESTRVAAEGVIIHYKKQGIKRLRFLASISDRTCPTCEGLNGQIFNLNESSGIIPVHDWCRCAWISITE